MIEDDILFELNKKIKELKVRLYQIKLKHLEIDKLLEERKKLMDIIYKKIE